MRQVVKPGSAGAQNPEDTVQHRIAYPATAGLDHRPVVSDETAVPATPTQSRQIQHALGFTSFTISFNRSIA